MATRTPAKKATKSATKSATKFSDEERAAMRDYLAEKRGGGEGETAVLEKIAAMPPADRAIGKRIHAMVKASAPQLEPKLWYGMPAYAKNGKVVCFYKNASKFKQRYGTFGFEETAQLDQGSMWVTSFGLKALTDADEAKLAALVKKAAG